MFFAFFLIRQLDFRLSEFETSVLCSLSCSFGYASAASGVFEMPCVPIAWTVCNSSNYLSKSASQPFCEDPFISQFAFPNNKHVPAQCSEFLGVSGDVLSKLFLPEAHSGAWRTGAMAAINADARNNRGLG
jgi:hypothetical protein